MQPQKGSTLLFCFVFSQLELWIKFYKSRLWRECTFWSLHLLLQCTGWQRRLVGLGLWHLLNLRPSAALAARIGATVAAGKNLHAMELEGTQKCQALPSNRPTCCLIILAWKNLFGSCHWRCWCEDLFFFFLDNWSKCLRIWYMISRCDIDVIF